jgi:4-amino-4-deoxy-L-arabinose transferase-like glycosyltransferase
MLGRGPGGAVFALVVLVFAAAILAAAGVLPPIQDETYYWTWSRALSWSYVDHPPGIALVLRASTALFGDGLFGLRAPGVLSMLVVGACSLASERRLSGGLAGTCSPDVVSLLLLLGAPMFAIGFVPATPDPVQGAVLALAVYALIRALEDRSSARWKAAAAFLIVAGTIVKHSSGMIAVFMITGLLVSERGRRLLLSRAFMAGIVAGVVFLLPWLIADLSNGGGSLQYQESRVLTRGAPRGLLAIPVFIGGVLIALGPAGGASVLIQGARALKSRARTADFVLASGALGLLATCFIPVWRGGGELNWSMPALILMLPAISASTAIAGSRRTIGVFAALSGAFTLVVLVHIAHPFLPVPPVKDTTFRGAGFDTVAEKVGALAERIDARAIVTRRYQMASMMRYHLRDKIPVVELGSLRRSQYDAWSKPRLCAGDVAVVVSYAPSIPPEIAARALPEIDTLRVDRTARGETIESFFVVPIRLDTDAFGPDPRCNEVSRDLRGGA